MDILENGNIDLENMESELCSIWVMLIIFR
jgi:hypothetical protein